MHNKKRDCHIETTAASLEGTVEMIKVEETLLWVVRTSWWLLGFQLAISTPGISLIGYNTATEQSS